MVTFGFVAPPPPVGFDESAGENWQKGHVIFGGPIVKELQVRQGTPDHAGKLMSLRSVLRLRDKPNYYKKVLRQ